MKYLKDHLKLVLIEADMLWIHVTGMYTGTSIRTLDNATPYFSYNATEWIKTFLNQKMQVFEWGSGSSTIFFSKLVGKIVSIENNREWASKIKWYLWLKNIRNCSIQYIPSEKNQPTGDTNNLSEYRSSNPSLQKETFKKYVESIKKYPDNYFDLIIVDGRARSSCLVTARNYTKIGGVIILDDSERTEYTEACKLLQNDFSRVDFEGKTPFNGDTLQKTTIFKKIK